MQSRGEGERQGPGPDDGASSGDQTSNDECGESEVDEPDSEVSDGEGSAEEGGSGTVWDWSPYFPAQFRRERFTMFYRAFEPRDVEDAWQIMDDWRAQGECEGPFQCGG